MYINVHRWREGIVFWDDAIDLNAPVDIIFLIHELTPHRGEYVTEHINYEHNLVGSDDPISNYSSTLRNTINKARRAPFTFEINNQPSLEMINTAVNAYNAFATSAHLPLLTSEFMFDIGTKQKLIITTVKLNGAPLFIHTFYRGANRVRLYHSFPALNRTLSATETLANPALHDYELRHFRSDLGVDIYDWGGAGRTSETDGKKLAIRDFKRRFGGKETIYFKARIPVGPNGQKIRETYYKI